MNDDSISLNKFVSSTGICSRREADAWIEAGRLKINGEVAVKGNRVFKDDKVLLDGKPLYNKPKQIYIALNKPVGITCTTDLKDKDNIIDFVNYPKRIFPIGRIDKPSTGLILLTNDGDIVNKILREEFSHEKEYVVKTNKDIDDKFITAMSNGIPILGKKTKKCKVSKVNNRVFKIVLTQGLNRQIRRMCEYLDYKVVSLKRIRIMHIKLGELKLGKWRYLNDSEIEELFKRINH